MQNNKFFKVVENKYRKHPNKSIIVPTRSTKESAGYDIYLPDVIQINPCEMKIVWTDIKVSMNGDEFFQIHMRSSISSKYKIMLGNITGIIDSDYYNNPKNDGNIGLMLYNYGTDYVTLNEGTKIAQGIFLKYGITNNDNATSKRIGGIGSTGDSDKK